MGNHRNECSIYARPESGAAMLSRKYTNARDEDIAHVNKILHCKQMQWSGKKNKKK